jgi:hypothetical protein
MYVCGLYVHLCVGVYVRVWGRMHICGDVYVCGGVCMFVGCMYIPYVCVWGCMDVCGDVCMCV